jgi:hypothetical protein
MDAKLVVTGGKATTREVALTLPAVVGRGREAAVRVVHPSVSRRHCEIYELDGALVVRDVGSTNGTFVGAERVDEALLKPGDELTVGPLTFRVEYKHKGAYPTVGKPTAANGTHPMPEVVFDNDEAPAAKTKAKPPKGEPEKRQPKKPAKPEPAIDETVFFDADESMADGAGAVEAVETSPDDFFASLLADDDGPSATEEPMFAEGSEDDPLFSFDEAGAADAALEEPPDPKMSAAAGAAADDALADFLGAPDAESAEPVAEFEAAAEFEAIEDEVASFEEPAAAAEPVAEDDAFAAWLGTAQTEPAEPAAEAREAESLEFSEPIAEELEEPAAAPEPVAEDDAFAAWLGEPEAVPEEAPPIAFGEIAEEPAPAPEPEAEEDSLAAWLGEPEAASEEAAPIAFDEIAEEPAPAPEPVAEEDPLAAWLGEPEAVPEEALPIAFDEIAEEPAPAPEPVAEEDPLAAWLGEPEAAPEEAAPIAFDEIAEEPAPAPEPVAEEDPLAEWLGEPEATPEEAAPIAFDEIADEPAPTVKPVAEEDPLAAWLSEPEAAPEESAHIADEAEFAPADSVLDADDEPMVLFEAESAAPAEPQFNFGDQPPAAEAAQFEEPGSLDLEMPPETAAQAPEAMTTAEEAEAALEGLHPREPSVDETLAWDFLNEPATTAEPTEAPEWNVADEQPADAAAAMDELGLAPEVAAEPPAAELAPLAPDLEEDQAWSFMSEELPPTPVVEPAAEHEWTPNEEPSAGTQEDIIVEEAIFGVETDDLPDAPAGPVDDILDWSPAEPAAPSAEEASELEAAGFMPIESSDADDGGFPGFGEPVADADLEPTIMFDDSTAAGDEPPELAFDLEGAGTAAGVPPAEPDFGEAFQPFGHAEAEPAPADEFGLAPEPTRAAPEPVVARAPNPTEPPKKKRGWWPFGRKTQDVAAPAAAAAPLAAAAATSRELPSIPVDDSLGDAFFSSSEAGGEPQHAGVASAEAWMSAPAAPRATGRPRVNLGDGPSAELDTLDVMFPPIEAVPSENEIARREAAAASEAAAPEANEQQAFDAAPIDLEEPQVDAGTSLDHEQMIGWTESTIGDEHADFMELAEESLEVESLEMHGEAPIEFGESEVPELEFEAEPTAEPMFDESMFAADEPQPDAPAVDPTMPWQDNTAWQEEAVPELSLDAEPAPWESEASAEASATEENPFAAGFDETAEPSPTASQTSDDDLMNFLGEPEAAAAEEQVSFDDLVAFDEEPPAGDADIPMFDAAPEEPPEKPKPTGKVDDDDLADFLRDLGK